MGEGLAWDDHDVGATFVEEGSGGDGFDKLEVGVFFALVEFADVKNGVAGLIAEGDQGGVLDIEGVGRAVFILGDGEGALAGFHEHALDPVGREGFFVVKGEGRVVGDVHVGGVIGGVVDPYGHGVGADRMDAEGADADERGVDGRDGEGEDDDADPEASFGAFFLFFAFEGRVLFLLPAKVVLIWRRSAHGGAPWGMEVGSYRRTIVGTLGRFCRAIFATARVCCGGRGRLGLWRVDRVWLGGGLGAWRFGVASTGVVCPKFGRPCETRSRSLSVIEHDETGTEPTDVMVLRDDLIRVPLRTETLPPATHTNSYVVGYDERWFVVDVGGDGSAQSLGPLFDVIDDHCGGKLSGVLITHAHPDHHPGLSALIARYPMAVAYAHPKVVDAIASFHPRVDWGTVEEGDAFFGTDLLLTEGHAVGHLSVVGRDYVLCGDMMAGMGTIVVAPPDGDMLAYFDSLERLAALGDRVCFPAHGGAALSVRDRAEFYLEHRRARERKIFAALDGTTERTLEEVTVRAYDDVPSALHGLAQHSALAHLQKLRAEGRARSVNGAWART